MNVPLRYLLLFTLLVQTLFVSAQTITGRVLDKQTNEPLPFVNIFVSNTTKGTQSSQTGTFTLSNLAPGYTKIVASMLGYKSFEKELVLRPNEAINLTIALEIDTRLLNEVKITGKKDKQWKRYYEDFEKVFVGKTKNAKNCKIQNPYEIDIEKIDQTLTARADKTLEIENKALGYSMSYQLLDFQNTKAAYSFSGHVLFKLLVASNEKENLTWETNRRKAYQGSLRHFLKSVVEGRSQQEGFKVYVENGSQKDINRQRFFDDNDLTEISPDTLARFNPALQEVTLPVQRYEVHYLKNTDREHWYVDLKNEVSWLELSGERFAFSYNGIMADSRQIQLTGSMSKHRMADALPQDYQPPTSVADEAASQETEFVQKIQDKTYLSLNDVFFLRGDTLMYRSYALNGPASSQSRVLYVVLRDKKRAFFKHKIVLQQGAGSGHYVVPDSLAAGVYQIIAYTNLTRNAGEAFMFRQNIRIMGEQVAEAPSPFSMLFYPESGVLLSGINNRVVARVSGEMPPNATGQLFQNDSLLLELRLDTAAVQTFFVKPSEKSKIDFRLSGGQKLPFPAAVQGYTMQVDALNDPKDVVVRLLNNLPQAARKPLRLLAYAADSAIFEAEIIPQRNLTTIRMSRQELGVEGPIELLLRNEDNQVLATRAVYLPHTGGYTSQIQFQNDSLKVQIVSPPQALPFEGRLAVWLRYFDQPTEPQINHYLDIGAFVADVSPSFDLTQPKIIDQLLMATPLPSNQKTPVKALELERGFVFSGRVSSNRKPLAISAQLTGFIQNDSVKVLFSGKTNDVGRFTTKPMQFYGKASLVAKATAANNKFLTIDFDQSDPFVPAWRDAFVPPLKPLLKSQGDVAAFLNKRKSQTLQEVVIKRKKSAPRDMRKPYLFPDASIKIDDERFGGLRLFEILRGRMGGILVDEEKGVTNFRLRGLMGIFLNGTPSTWHMERYTLASDIASIDILMDPALALGMGQSAPFGGINILLKKPSDIVYREDAQRVEIEGYTFFDERNNVWQNTLQGWFLSELNFKNGAASVALPQPLSNPIRSVKIEGIDGQGRGIFGLKRLAE